MLTHSSIPMSTSRGVSSVISVVLMVAAVVIVGAIVAGAVFEFTADLDEPVPNVAETSGEFRVAPSGVSAGSNQIVRVTHVAGENVAVENIEIIVRAIGPSLDTRARLVGLPAAGGTLDASNIQGNTGLIDQSGHAQVIVSSDTNTWAAGETIAFRINTGEADFRDGNGPDAAELAVSIVYTDTESTALLSEETFRP